MRVLLIVAAILVSHDDVSAQNPVVSTQYGDVEGVSVPIHTGQVIDTFMAVPFARAPVDERRFMVSRRDVFESGHIFLCMRLASNIYRKVSPSGVYD